MVCSVLAREVQNIVMYLNSRLFFYFRNNTFRPFLAGLRKSGEIYPGYVENDTALASEMRRAGPLSCCLDTDDT